MGKTLDSFNELNFYQVSPESPDFDLPLNLSKHSNTDWSHLEDPKGINYYKEGCFQLSCLIMQHTQAQQLVMSSLVDSVLRREILPWLNIETSN